MLLAHVVEYILNNVTDSPLAVRHAHVERDLPGKLMCRQFLLKKNLSNLWPVTVREDNGFIPFLQKRNELFHAPSRYDELLFLDRLVVAGNVEGIATESD